jgi:hypothetical protein
MSSAFIEFVSPGNVNDGVLVEVIHGGHDAILEFLLGRDAADQGRSTTNASQGELPQTDPARTERKHTCASGTGEFGKEALDQVEP